MRRITSTAGLIGTLLAMSLSGQQTPKTLVMVWAHADDESPVGPIVARYAREGVQIYTIIATDGSQGGANTSIPRGAELARVRGEEASCASEAFGIHPPILLGFPDGALGHYAGDSSLVYRLTQRLQEELQRLRPDAVITWGPDGGTGHPDHRLVGDIVTQLARAAAPGVPERVFYASIPADGFRVINPGRGAPPFLIPQPKYFSTRISFTPPDLATARRALACHKTQFTEDVVERISDSMRTALQGSMPFASAFLQPGTTDLFR